MARSAQDTTAWVGNSLKTKGVASDFEVIAPQMLRIMRPSFDPFIAGIISVSLVNPEDVQGFVDDGRASIAVNVPKESVWSGPAIRLLEMQPMAFGGIRDLMSATLKTEDVRQYVRSEFSFLERGLRQHSMVSGFTRENERLYSVHRSQMSSLSVAVLNEYELTGDHVRVAKDRLGAFSIILQNNPNGTATSGALAAATSIGVEVLKWGEFLGRLRHP
jgi:hypothetical protein